MTEDESRNAPPKTTEEGTEAGAQPLVPSASVVPSFPAPQVKLPIAGAVPPTTPPAAPEVVSAPAAPLPAAALPPATTTQSSPKPTSALPASKPPAAPRRTARARASDLFSRTRQALGGVVRRISRPKTEGVRPARVEPARDSPESAAVGTDRTTQRAVVLLMVVSLTMVLFHMQPSSRENANTGSRYATIESLVDRGTYNIDASRYVFTPDKVKARGHYVSSKPPLLPTYGAGVYFLLKKATGYNIVDNEGIVVWTVGVFTGFLSHLVFLIYFYRLAREMLTQRLSLLITVAAACFAYLGVAYATAINNHSTGAALAVVGFYHAFRARHGLGGSGSWLFAGFWLGVLPAVDLTSMALTAFTGLYLLSRDWKRTLLLYTPAALPGIASQLVLSKMATGTWIPAYADASLMTYAGSYFGGKRSGIDALYEPKWVYAFHVLLGHHGVFSMTPIFGFSAYESVRRLWRRDRWAAETLVLAATIIVVFTFYIARTHNYGGWCVGMRWLVPVMPWLLLFFGLWFEHATVGRWKWAAVVLAFAVSAFNVQDGLTSPFQFSLWHNFLDGEPNRNRLGPRWNLSQPKGADKRRPPPRARPRPPPPPPALPH